ncbi:MAG: DUF1634 domain-containing protein [Candidatus Caldarchaeales archaeon]
MDLEELLGVIMAVGVVISLSLMSVGLVMHLLERENLELDLSGETLVVEKSFYSFIANISSSQQLSITLMRLGLAALMMTPYSRAVGSLIYFTARRDVKYIVIAGVVVVALTLLFF